MTDRNGPGRHQILLIAVSTVALAGCMAHDQRAGTRSAVPAPLAPHAEAAMAVGELPITAPRAHWDFPVRSQADATTVIPLDSHVSLIEAPIRVWFFEEDGLITRVRVVGHGNSSTCELASLALLAAVSAPDIEGFITYGAGELHARASGPSSATRFDSLAHELHRALEAIVGSFDDIEVYDVQGDPDRQLAITQTTPPDVQITYAFADSIPNMDGPAFVPARSWINGQTRPIQFVVTARELGLDATVFRHLATELAGYPETLKMLREMRVDAVLRGWSFSIDPADEPELERIIANKVPIVWQRVVAELDRKGIMVSDNRVGGDLVGPSVFYRVTDQGDDTFLVTPTYVVHGDYLERWSPKRHTVVITRMYE